MDCVQKARERNLFKELTHDIVEAWQACKFREKLQLELKGSLLEQFLLDWGKSVFVLLRFSMDWSINSPYRGCFFQRALFQTSIVLKTMKQMNKQQ